jgi:hypothetical protein
MLALHVAIATAAGVDLFGYARPPTDRSLKN